MTYNPIWFALWLFVTGVGFGVSLGWGTLVVLGFVAPPVVLALYLVSRLLK